MLKRFIEPISGLQAMVIIASLAGIMTNFAAITKLLFPHPEYGFSAFIVEYSFSLVGVIYAALMIISSIVTLFVDHECKFSPKMALLLGSTLLISTPARYMLDDFTITDSIMSACYFALSSGMIWTGMNMSVKVSRSADELRLSILSSGNNPYFTK
ncbi:hypothetical protein [Sulfitobacter sp. R18_1]|uniref:hypothetical protein n=1 Tax=Sulfitobacter sp. R18_1 TaxID=2821104 RepID=UPI001ADA9999|nr:hypothetical protein [Sulfitobacter sp. R18_1]MBO9427979.1 hypothetical protein [Sulfitobacter sp. R18_1]